jgi:hypothetical protein
MAIRRKAAGMAIAVLATAAMASAADAAPGGQSKNNFYAACTSGTLAGETVFIPADTGNSVYRMDGTHLRVTRFEAQFPGESYVMDFGSKQGDLTCGGSVTTTAGTYIYFVTFTEVPPRS